MFINITTQNTALVIIIIWLIKETMIHILGMALNVEKFHKQGKCIYDKKEEKKDSNKKEERKKRK